LREIRGCPGNRRRIKDGLFRALMSLYMAVRTVMIVRSSNQARAIKAVLNPPKPSVTLTP